MKPYTTTRYAKLTFGRGHLICKRATSIDCPNEFGGIGNIIVHPVDNMLWTGDVHLVGHTFMFHFGNVTKIETRSTLSENDDEPWVLLWEYKGPFTYTQYEEAAKLLYSYLTS